MAIELDDLLEGEEREFRSSRKGRQPRRPISTEPDPQTPLSIYLRQMQQRSVLSLRAERALGMDFSEAGLQLGLGLGELICLLRKNLLVNAGVLPRSRAWPSGLELSIRRRFIRFRRNLNEGQSALCARSEKTSARHISGSKPSRSTWPSPISSWWRASRNVISETALCFSISFRGECRPDAGAGEVRPG